MTDAALTQLDTDSHKPSVRLRDRLPYLVWILGIAALVAAVLAGLPLRNLTVVGLVTFLGIYFITLFLWEDRHLKYMLVVPSILLLFVVTIFPTIYALTASVHDVNAITLNKTWEFVGLRNYQFILADRLTWQSLLLTAEVILLAVAVEFVLGFCIAFLLDRVPGLFLSIFLMPMMVTPIVAGLIWKYMFNLDNGFINLFLIQLGVNEVPWLTYDPIPPFTLIGDTARTLNFSYATFSYLIQDIWQWTPMIALLLYAGIRSLPVEPLESAYVDGANTFQMVRFVMLPMLKPVASVAILIRLVDIVKVYDPIWALFGTGFRTLNIYLGTFMFRMRDYSGGSALSIFVLLTLSLLLPIAFKILYRDDGENE